MVFGLATGIFVILTSLSKMDHQIWLQLHNFLMVVAVIYCGVIGFRSVKLFTSLAFGFIFFVVFSVLYLLCYIISTTLLVHYIDWIPFFYKDYTYQGYSSLIGYLRGENYYELLLLLLSSIAGSCGFYLVANFAGFLLGIVVRRESRTVT